MNMSSSNTPTAHVSDTVPLPPLTPAQIEDSRTRVLSKIMKAIGNPLERSLLDLFFKCSNDAQDFATDLLERQLTAFSERDDIRAYRSAIYLHDECNFQLSLIAGCNIPSAFHSVSLVDESLLSDVLSQVVPRCVQSAFEQRDCEGQVTPTHSAMLVPLLGLDGQAVGVAVFECCRRNAYSKKTLKKVRKWLAAIQVHIEVLYSLINRPALCPWHPTLHGWHFQHILDRACDAITSAIGKGVSTCTAWYCDPTKKTAHAIATAGYDTQYVSKRTLALHMSMVGDVFSGKDLEVRKFDPSSDPVFYERSKAKDMGLTEGFMIRLPQIEGGSHGGLVLAVYTRPIENSKAQLERSRQIEAGLPLIANRLRELASAFVDQRHRLLSFLIEREVSSRGTDAFGVVLKKLIGYLGCQAGSIFVTRANDSVLRCVATSGFLIAGSGRLGPRLRDATDGYDLDLHRSSFSVCSILNPWIPIRMNDTSDSTEHGLPAWLPSSGLPMSLLEEAIDGTVSNKRRLLMLGFTSPSGARGLIRLIRSRQKSPFVLCDESLIATVATKLVAALELWQLRPVRRQSDADDTTYISGIAIAKRHGPSELS